MSFRSRILVRNTLPRAEFAPNLQFKVVDGNVTIVPFTQLEIEQERRLYDEVKPSVVADAGLPFSQFKQSPDGSRTSNERDLDADCQVVSSMLEEKGYNLDKPMKGQNPKRSKQVEPQVEPKVESQVETKVEQKTE